MNDAESEGYIHPGPLRKDEFKGNGFMARTSFSGVVTIFIDSTACYDLESAPTEHVIAVLIVEQLAAPIPALGGRIEYVMNVGLEEAFVAHVQTESGVQP